jgi:two-component system response regulator DesR
MAVRIMIGNAHHLLLDALAHTLAGVPDFEVVGMAREEAAVVPVAERTSPGVLVLGADGTGSTATALARRVLAVRQGCKVVLVAPSPTRTLVEQAGRAGVWAVVPMDASLGHLVRTVRAVSVGCVPMHLPGARGRREPERECSLTDRERDVLRLTWAGASAKEVAKELCLASGTVRNVTSAALRKLDGRNRFDAARIAQERGWL